MSKAAALVGLVLAGGLSRRMGSDKALLAYDGEPQILRARRALARVCRRVLVSLRSEQVAAFRGGGLWPRMGDRGGTPLPQDFVVDELEDVGPVAGFLAAWRRVPGAALLVLAVDLPLVNVRLLRRLVEARDSEVLATAFVHADGTVEPLCTIWEPAAEPILRARARNSSVSLRKVLESSTVKRLEVREPARLRSVNTPREAAALKRGRPG